MFGPIPARVYECHCGWSKYVYGSHSDVLYSPLQIPPNECPQCQSELTSRAPTRWEKFKHGNMLRGFS